MIIRPTQELPFGDATGMLISMVRASKARKEVSQVALDMFTRAVYQLLTMGVSIEAPKLLEEIEPAYATATPGYKAMAVLLLLALSTSSTEVDTFVKKHVEDPDLEVRAALAFGFSLKVFKGMMETANAQRQAMAARQQAEMHKAMQDVSRFKL